MTSIIKLGHNQLKTLDQGVYEPILNLFSGGNYDPTTAFIDVDSSEFT